MHQTIYLTNEVGFPALLCLKQLVLYFLLYFIKWAIKQNEIPEMTTC